LNDTADLAESHKVFNPVQRWLGSLVIGVGCCDPPHRRSRPANGGGRTRAVSLRQAQLDQFVQIAAELRNKSNKSVLPFRQGFFVRL